ncbi:MAG: RnfABCDGE type electron transport complex subunit G [Marinilabiliaceae bacterium]|nr:RnfABCDGE type electron transport complex subunit G [Marinilabiliaceae bacterium]
MAKTESSLKNMFLTLLVIALIAGTSLGFVYKFTKEPIEASKLAKQQMAIKKVLPEYDNDPASEIYELKSQEGYVLKAFPAKRNGELVGVAIETITKKGFSGEIKIMVGLQPDGTIINYDVLEHKETPGLGSKMAFWFRPADNSAEKNNNEKNSFFKWLYGIKDGGGGNRSIIGKNPGKSNMKVSKDGGDIDAITAATISSRAFLDAISIAYVTYTNEKNKTNAKTGASKQIKEGGNNE